MSSPTTPAGKLSQEQIHAIAALIHEPRGRPRWTGAAWIGACGRGHLAVAAISLDGVQCDDCVPFGEGDSRPYYITLPCQEVLLAAFHLGGWDAVATAAKLLSQGE